LMATIFATKLRQHYRYYRNLKKYKKLSPKRKETLSIESHFYSQFIKKGNLCFDIGANIGDKTAMFLQLGAEVVAVEPQESCWRFLKRRFNNNVHIVNKALDKSVSRKEFFIDRSHTLSSMSKEWIATVKHSGRFSSRHKWKDKIRIETTTLDLLIKEFGRPDFCKIDVEGFELDVLQGLSQPIRTISLEFIPERIDASLKCIDYLNKLGNAEFNYCLNNSMSFALPEWNDCEGIKDRLIKFDKNAKNFGDIYVRFANGQRHHL